MFSAANYRALAAREKNAERKKILDHLAEAEERHALQWAARLKDVGIDVGSFSETVIEKLKRNMLLKSPFPTAIEMLEDGESEADKLYEELLHHTEKETDRAIILKVQQEEKNHSRVLQELTDPLGKQHPQSKLNRILRREHWHVTAGGWIGQAIYGVNDGLGAAFGVVSGVAGATSSNSEFILLSGIAAAIASALSMGSGAYLATKSEREVYEAEVNRERKEIEENPNEEREELELFYQLKGFSEEEARQMVSRLTEQPEHMLKILAHEELGLSEQTFPQPWKAAISATISTALGAIVPVLPFFFWTGTEGLVISFVISTLAHFLVGASKVFVTGRSWIKSGTEMTLVGLGEALVTYFIGLFLAPVL